MKIDVGGVGGLVVVFELVLELDLACEVFIWDDDVIVGVVVKEGLFK